MDFPPIGANKPFIVQCNGSNFAGYDDAEDAKKAAIAYKKPGDPKRRSGCACTAASWTVRDVKSDKLIYTAP